jgi:hypothetical protein
MAAHRRILERSDLVLACAHVLHRNGQSTHETVQTAERLGAQLGLRAAMIAHWEERSPASARGLLATRYIVRALLTSVIPIES